MRLEVLSGMVDYLVMYLIVTFDDETYIAADECMTHQKGLQETVTFILRVRGVNVIMITLKLQNSFAASIVLVTAVSPYARPGTSVFGAEEKAFFDGALVADNFPYFRVICDILIFSPSRLSPLNTRVLPVVENSCLPITAPISWQLMRSKLLYLFFSDVTVFCGPGPDLFTVDLLRVPTNRGRVFDFPRKI